GNLLTGVNGGPVTYDSAATNNDTFQPLAAFGTTGLPTYAQYGVGGNPAADVEVRASATGAILARRLVKSSGNKDWDDAVLRAIDRTGELPRDLDGRVPPVIVITFTP
ncbi:MAG TPA: energy transducer TonB, partial [Rubrivivax sp.]|nr:energy transducer TonB [Rubrivivax sp.]